jgi:hypothetical protein
MSGVDKDVLGDDDVLGDVARPMSEECDEPIFSTTRRTGPRRVGPGEIADDA